MVKNKIHSCLCEKKGHFIAGRELIFSFHPKWSKYENDGNIVHSSKIFKVDFDLHCKSKKITLLWLFNISNEDNYYRCAVSINI